MEFNPCNKCCDGYIYEIIEGEEYLKKCSCLINYQKEIDISIRIKKSNIPDNIKEYKISDYVGIDENKNITKIKKFISEFDTKYKDTNLYFYGDYGTQKSTLSRYIIKELLLKNKNCYYILADDLIKLLLKAEREEDILEFILNLKKDIDFLVIDELSDDKVTIFQSGYQIPYLTTFLKGRLESSNKSTLFISNYNINKLYESKFGKTIADLINRECKNSIFEFKDIYTKIEKGIIDIWE